MTSQSRSWLPSPEGLTGAEGFTSTMWHKHGCWHGALVLGRVTLSTDELLECPQRGGWLPPQVRGDGEKGGSCNVFYALAALAVTLHHVHDLLFVRNESLSTARTHGKEHEVPLNRGAPRNLWTYFKTASC